MYFYEILQSIMEEKNLRVSDVARLSGLTDSTVRSIIYRKNKTVALEVASKLSKGLNVPIERLNGDELDDEIENNSVAAEENLISHGKLLIGSKLKEVRQKTGMNKKDFASYLGIKYTTYNGYETGSRDPSSDFLILFSKKLDISIDYLMGLTDEKDISHSYQLESTEYEHIKKYRALDERGRHMINLMLDAEYDHCKCNQFSDISKHSGRLIQFYQRLASAGTGQIVFDDVPVDLVEIPDIPEYKRVKYAIGVNGDSMEPLYQDGDVLLVEPSREISLGDIGIFLIDGQSYVKQLGENVLISINKKYDPIPITDETECLGLVISKMPFTPKISLEEAMALEVGRKVLLDIDKANQNIG